MKDLLSEEQYYCKICTSSMESNALPSFKETALSIMDYSHILTRKS